MLTRDASHGFAVYLYIRGMDTYFEFTIECSEETKELLIAELAEIGYDGFVDHDNGFSAFIPQAEFNAVLYNDILLKYQVNPNDVPHSVIEPQNWNAQWEANYEPIIVADKILVRAPFHQVDEAYEHVITIQPKNTFGTGHHETTQLVLELLLSQPVKDTTLFDYGCGTGVLGLMALKLGAKHIIGNDIDTWCVDNIDENKHLNNLTAFEFRLGNLAVLKTDELFDGILANINKNILLDSFRILVKHMKPGAFLLISGFYETDLSDLQGAAEQVGLQLRKHISKNNWCAAQLQFVPKSA